MKTPFSQTFVRLRKEAGFETAYQFYHKSGGAKVLQCSFPNYLRIEKGSHLPQPHRLPLLCTLLRLPLKPEELRTLVRAYLETWTKSKELADWMLLPFGAAAEPAGNPDPARQALQRLVREEGHPLSLAQYEAVMESAASYWCYRVLTTSKDAYAAADLASMLDIKEAEIGAALESLRRRRIAVRQRDGRYKSPLAGEFILFPDSSLIEPKLMERVFKYNDAMIKKRGKLLDTRYFGTRVDLPKLQGYIPHYREAIRSLNAYTTLEKTPQSALVFVEGRIFKLFDF